MTVGKKAQSQNLCSGCPALIRIGPLVPSSGPSWCQKSAELSCSFCVPLMEPQQNGGRGGVSALAHSLTEPLPYNLHLVAPVSCPQGQTSFSCHFLSDLCFPRPPATPNPYPLLVGNQLGAKMELRLIPQDL